MKLHTKMPNRLRNICSWLFNKHFYFGSIKVVQFDTHNVSNYGNLSALCRLTTAYALRRSTRTEGIPVDFNNGDR